MFEQRSRIFFHSLDEYLLAPIVLGTVLSHGHIQENKVDEIPASMEFIT